jgi:hypothetical protein
MKRIPDGSVDVAIPPIIKNYGGINRISRKSNEILTVNLQGNNMSKQGDLGLQETLYKGDCLVEMSRIPDASVDMVLADPP